MSLEAIAAVHGAISTGLEGHLGGAAAAIADHFVHLTGAIVAAVGVAASSAASGAAAGLILEALLGEESLLGSGEHEVLAAVTALQRLVLIHDSQPPHNCCTLTVCHSVLPWFTTGWVTTKGGMNLHTWLG